MRRRLFNWQGQRFLYLGLEGEPGVALPQQSSGLFARADAELAAFGFSLERNTVRTRVFGRSSAARAAGSAARTQALVGQARAAGSSYVSVPHFFSSADVGLDLVVVVALGAQHGDRRLAGLTGAAPRIDAALGMRLGDADRALDLAPQALVEVALDDRLRLSGQGGGRREQADRQSGKDRGLSSSHAPTFFLAPPRIPFSAHRQRCHRAWG